MSGQPVEVPDVAPPSEPRTKLDELSDYLSDRYPKRKADVVQLMQRAKQLRDKGDVVLLGYEAMLFRIEVDEWYFFANQVLDELHGDQLDVARSEQSQANQERGSKRAPAAEILKARAAQFTAPLKRAVGELKSTREFMDKVLYWCQAQQKIIAAEEYGDLFSSRHEAPQELYERGEVIVHPPSLAGELSRLG